MGWCRETSQTGVQTAHSIQMERRAWKGRKGAKMGQRCDLQESLSKKGTESEGKGTPAESQGHSVRQGTSLIFRHRTKLEGSASELRGRQGLGPQDLGNCLVFNDNRKL
jgi:hypothetical protein